MILIYLVVEQDQFSDTMRIIFPTNGIPISRLSGAEELQRGIRAA